ncbi:MAG: hypothetical protein ACRC1K_26955 [Planctomycetia bacterium]
MPNHRRPPPSAFPLSRHARRCLLVCGLASLVGCSAFQPVRPVEEGALYRSGQLSSKQLENAIGEQKIRTVVNLRGVQPGARWYKDEVEVCEKNQVEHVDVTLSGPNPDREEIGRLLDAYRTAAKPILVHGRFSQGDAGFAAGLYRQAVLGQPHSEARKELAVWESRRVPVARLASRDKFLNEFKGENEFYAQSKPAADELELPELADDRDPREDRRRDDSPAAKVAAKEEPTSKKPWYKRLWPFGGKEDGTVVASKDDDRYDPWRDGDGKNRKSSALAGGTARGKPGAPARMNDDVVIDLPMPVGPPSDTYNRPAADFYGPTRLGMPTALSDRARSAY